jgi:hypothetical protein
MPDKLSTYHAKRNFGMMRAACTMIFGLKSTAR